MRTRGQISTRLILTIDNDPKIQAWYSAVLTNEGTAVLTASDGAAGLELFRENLGAVDLVLLNVRLPGLDGPHTLAALRELDPGVCCCFVTSDPTPYTATELRALGTDVLFRPFQLGELTTMIAPLLAERKARALSVLIVEDDDDTADSLAELLQIFGYQVRVARTGQEALALAATESPDVVFLDLWLPDMDGCEVARLFSSTEHGRPPLLIAVTGDGTEAGRTRSKAAGCALHLLKPVHPATLLGILARFARVVG